MEMDWFQTGKEVHQGCIFSPNLFNLYAEYTMQNARLDEAEAGIKISRRNINNLSYADDTILMAESEEELKRLLMKVKEESEKAGLKLNIQKTKIVTSSPITSWQINGETMETVRNFVFLCSKITSYGECSHEIKTFSPSKESYDQPRQHIKKQRHYFASKGLSCQSYGFSSSMYGELDYKESWVLKDWCFWTVVLEKTLESPLDCSEIKPVNPKRNQSLILVGRTDAEAETPIFWPSDARSWLIRNYLDAGKDWRQEKKGMTENEMVGWHHRISGYEFEQALGDGEGQRSLSCYVVHGVTISWTWLRK